MVYAIRHEFAGQQFVLSTPVTFTDARQLRDRLRSGSDPPWQRVVKPPG
jgi:hypothetical protein